MKRGERAPYRVRFRWLDTGAKGTIVCTDQWTAEHRAGEIRSAAERQGRECTVEIIHVAP